MLDFLECFRFVTPTIQVTPEKHGHTADMNMRQGNSLEEKGNGNTVT